MKNPIINVIDLLYLMYVNTDISALTVLPCEIPQGIALFYGNSGI